MCRSISIGVFSPTTPLKIRGKGKIRHKKAENLLGNDFVFLYSRKMTPVRRRNKVKLQLYYVGVHWVRNLRYYDLKKSQV